MMVLFSGICGFLLKAIRVSIVDFQGSVESYDTLLDRQPIQETVIRVTTDSSSQYSVLLEAQLERLPKEPFGFLQRILPHKSDERLLESDVVQLSHCDLSDLNWDSYAQWSLQILQGMLPKIQQARHTPDDWRAMKEEFILGLLEVFATHSGHCRFDSPTHDFPLSIHAMQSNPYTFNSTLQRAAAALQAVASSTFTNEEARLAIVIVAFQDADHLARLIQALHRPQHYMIIHLERRTDPDYREQVMEIALQYNNVVVLQFGTITYRTDAVSLINLQIMKWLVVELRLPYDYHVTLGGAAYPLFSAKELALHLRRTSHQQHDSNDNDVWLGELTGGRQGTRVRSPQHDYLQRKRLVSTRSGPEKQSFRIKPFALLNASLLNLSIPTDIQSAMQYKTNSGNQAVFSRNVVKDMLKHDSVLNMFALAKYGCCCCLEERTWIAAMALLGRHEPALRQAGMWQVWGGVAERCGSSMNNAVLSANASICFRVEDASEGVKRNRDEALYIYGDQVVEYLKDAKRRGVMFARKFRSNDTASMKLLEQIQRELHDISF